MLPKNRVSSHPGEILLHEYLEPLGLTQAKVALNLKIPLNRVNEIVRGKRGMSAETAVLLSAYFRTSPQFWMNLQSNHDLSKALLTTRKVPPARQRRRKSAA